MKTSFSKKKEMILFFVHILKDMEDYPKTQHEPYAVKHVDTAAGNQDVYGNQGQVQPPPAAKHPQLRESVEAATAEGSRENEATYGPEFNDFKIYLHGIPFEDYTSQNLKPLVFHHLQQPNQVEGLAVDETGELYLRDPDDYSRMYPIKSWDNMTPETRREVFNVLCQYEQGQGQCDEWEEIMDEGEKKYENREGRVVKELVPPDDDDARKNRWLLKLHEDGKYQYTNAAGDTVEFKPSELFADSQWEMVKADLPLLDYYYTNSKGKSAWKLWDWSQLQNKDPLGPLL